MPQYQDPTGHSLFVTDSPQRIVSLVPSQTELLFDLQLGERVVGITKFCIHPAEWFRKKNRIGGTKDPHPDRIRVLQPDLIIANKEENRKVDILLLQQEFPTYTTDVNTIPEALEMIQTIGLITGSSEKAGEIISNIKKTLPPAPSALKTAAYLIWKDPFMTIGGDTFISEMLAYAGFQNLFAAQKRYPETDIEELSRLAPEFLFLSSEPYPFKEKHQAALQEALPQSKVIIVDGEMFSWYGSRMAKAGDYFREIKSLLDL